jgi:hypothetical protein
VVSLDRRALLAGGSALLLSACGVSGARNPEPPRAGSDTAVRGDAELLQALLEIKGLAMREYEGLDRYAPSGFGEIEREHADLLRSEVEKRRGHAAEGFSVVRPGPGRDAARGRLIDVEDTTIALIVDALPKLSDPGLRVLAARMLAIDAEQLAVLRSRLGQTPAPDAFVAGRKAL